MINTLVEVGEPLLCAKWQRDGLEKVAKRPEALRAALSFHLCPYLHFLVGSKGEKLPTGKGECFPGSLPLRRERKMGWSVLTPVLQPHTEAEGATHS